MLMEDTPLTSIVTTIKQKLESRPEILLAVQKIGKTIEKTGMSIEDCSLLARMTSQELSALSAEIPEVPLYFRLKRVQYKEKLLEVLHAQATEMKDVKIAMYLLEANFSDEFVPANKKAAAKTRSAEEGTDLERLMAKVRNSAPNSPVVEEHDTEVENASKTLLIENSGLVKH